MSSDNEPKIEQEEQEGKEEAIVERSIEDFEKNVPKGLAPPPPSVEEEEPEEDRGESSKGEESQEEKPKKKKKKKERKEEEAAPAVDAEQQAALPTPGLVESDDKIRLAWQLLQQEFRKGTSRNVHWRVQQLKALRQMMQENKDAIIAAVMKDLGKQHVMEVNTSEYNLVMGELEEYIKNVKSWSKPEKVYTPIASQPGSSYVYKDPLGVVLIMSPWNYPVNLAIVPLIGAIAAGNCVFLKVSRHSQTVSETLCRLIPKYLDTNAIIVEGNGGASTITELMTHKWDHVFFTGSVSVGRIVYQAAAKFLTPCTLELGGKNPCIVDDTVNLQMAAKRIAWGKFFNAGQTCIGVDYVLVVKEREEAFLEAVKQQILRFYGENPKESKSFARIISRQHVQRLKALLDDAEVFVGGESDEETRYFSPTVLTKVRLDTTLMTDEIFGPIMPVIPIDDVPSALRFIEQRPKPLALYLYTASSKLQEEVLSVTTSGTAVINDCLLQFTNSNLPFGGVGDSGLGAYHGHRTFDVFTHRKAVMIRGTLDVPVRFPPYEDAVVGISKEWAVDTFTKIAW